MLRTLKYLVVANFCSLGLFAQEIKKEGETIKTKIETFTSKTGVITKLVDFKLLNLKERFGSSETRIRKISNGSISAYFYQIEKQGKYGSSTASVEYNDLIELLKALRALKSEVEKDLLSSDYLENKFTTVDGLQMGYFVDKGKINWFIKLEKYGSDNTIFIENGDIIDNAFNDAKSKIEDLKK